MKRELVAAALVLVLPVVMSADGKKKNPPSMAGKPAPSSASNAKKEAPPAEKSTPPGLAKKSKLPPGLEKKFGSKPSGAAYVAFDPQKTDRAWFLVDGKWKLEEGFDTSLVGEVKASLAMPKVQPPVPLPDVDVKLQVVKFD